MLLALMVDGELRTRPQGALAADDRGLQFGDGLFETALLTGGQIRFFQDHLTRLHESCARLGIACPAPEVLQREAAMLVADRREGILKIIVTRGRGLRGYRPPPQPATTRLLLLYAPTDSTDPATSADSGRRPSAADTGIEVRWCTTRLGRNPALAGIKHLNRLEQIMARLEWDDAGIADGLLLDCAGNLVCATSANVFLVLAGTLCTPELSHCGVRGVMRARVLECAVRLGIPTVERALSPADLALASEAFLTNAVQGIRPIGRLNDLNWTKWPLASKLSAALEV